MSEEAGVISEVENSAEDAEKSSSETQETNEGAAEDADQGAEDEGDKESEAEEDTVAKEIEELKLVIAQLENDKEGLAKELEEEQRLHEKASTEKDDLKAKVRELMQASKTPSKASNASATPATEAGTAEEESEVVAAPQPATPQERMESTNAMRSAAMSGDVEALRAAIETAESIGLTFEAQTARKRLAKLEKK